MKGGIRAQNTTPPASNQTKRSAPFHPPWSNCPWACSAGPVRPLLRPMELALTRCVPMTIFGFDPKEDSIQKEMNPSYFELEN